MEFKDVIAEILTGLESGPFEQYADEPAKGDEDFQDAVDTIAGLMDGTRYHKWVLLATADFIKSESAHVRVDEVEDYLQEHYWASGATVGETLQDYAASLDGMDTGLGKLYNQLDEAGGVDYFDWEAFADSGSTYVMGLNFLKIPVTGLDADAVYLFTDG